MGRNKPTSIGDWHFETQAEALGYAKKLLNRSPLKTPITGVDNNSFLRSLVGLHPRAAQKIGVGIQHFTVEPAVHGTRCFYITRVDGTRTDFSYLKCVRGSK
jgi:hypothetical protein